MKVPYTKIQEVIEDIFNEDSRTIKSEVSLEIAKDDVYESRPSIIITALGAERTETRMGGTSPRNIEAKFRIEVAVINNESIRASCAQRDDLIGDIEEILQEANTRTKLTNQMTTGVQILFVLIDDTILESGADEEDENFLMTGNIFFTVTMRG